MPDSLVAKFHLPEGTEHALFESIRARVAPLLVSAYDLSEFDIIFVKGAPMGDVAKLVIRANDTPDGDLHKAFVQLIGALIPGGYTLEFDGTGPQPANDPIGRLNKLLAEREQLRHDQEVLSAEAEEHYQAQQKEEERMIDPNGIIGVMAD